MTQSINTPVFDFSDDEKIAKALNEAPAVKAIKAKQGLVPAPKKAAPKAKGKAGRIVGISADENKFLQELFAKLISDSNYATMTSSEAFKKIEARYNK